MATAAERLAEIAEAEEAAFGRLLGLDLGADAMIYGVDWYADAQRAIMAMAATHGRTVETVAGVVAALSPRTAWSQNLAAADRILADREARVGTGGNRRKARAIVDGADPMAVLVNNGSSTGHKVRAFYMNLIGHHDHVTVDVWAWRAATGGDERIKRLDSAAWYGAVARAYARAAAARGLAPAVFQAVVWCEVRGAHA